MAPKRQSPLDNPPAASSPAEESESGSEYETDSDEESQQTQTPKPTSVVEAAPHKKHVVEKKAPSTPKKPAVAEKKADGGSESDDDSESDGESESESDSEEEATEEIPSKQQQPPKSPAKSPPAKASGSKRPTEPEPKPKPKPKPKRPKKDSDPAPSPAPAPVQNKPLFQRVWSEADEIAILEGMIAYTANTGLSPNSNLPDFLDYIKKFLKFDVSLPQLKNKMARLKKRHQTCVAKEKKGQKPVNINKPHEAKVFDLLVKVWGPTGSGSGSGGQGSSGSNGGLPPKKKRKADLGLNPGSGGQGSSGSNGGLPPKKKKKKADLGLNPGSGGQGSSGFNGGLPPKKKQKKADLGLNPCASSDIVLDKCLGDMGISEALLQEGLELIGAPKQAEMKEEWRQLRIAELELCVKRTQLMREQTTSILEAVKSSER